MERIAARRLLARPVAAVFQPAFTLTQRQMSIASVRHSSSLPPTVFSTDFWKGLVPKPLRKAGSGGDEQKTKIKEKGWNPATFYIVIFILIGSMSINQIAIKNEYSSFEQHARTKTTVLRGIIDKLQRGEEVDVETVLGTGDATSEQEWQDMLKELQDEDAVRDSRRKDQPKQTEAASQTSEKNEPAPAPEMPDTNTTAKLKKFTGGDFY